MSAEVSPISYEPNSGYWRRPNPAFSDLTWLDIQEHYDFCIDLFEEALDSPAIPERLGPCYPDIADEVQAADTLLSEIHPDLQAEHTFSTLYQSWEAKAKSNEIERSLTDQQYHDKWSLSRMRLQALHDLGESFSQTTISPEIKPGLLEEPPYCYQGDGDPKNSGQACFNACFRMVFAGITGDFLHERSVRRAGQYVTNSSTMEDERYLRSFNTPTFRKNYPEKTVVTYTFIGASMGMLAKVVGKLKSSKPNSSIYSIVNLQTETRPFESIWHTNILLGTIGDQVLVHDPTDYEHGAANRAIDMTSFHRRWAVALNRAHLIIAD
jgi:hypothetical protein